MKLNIKEDEMMSEQWLAENGFDGLYCLNEFVDCVCEKSDLFPCGEYNFDCIPGVYKDCRICADKLEYDCKGDETDFCIHPLITSSENWMKYDEFKDIQIVDYDGWNKSNFEYSWNEPITQDEFIRRLSLL